jgi:hypothetical protein
MRIRNRGVIGVAALALLASVLLSGCELREGVESEYGKSSLKAKENVTELSDNSSGQDVRTF